MGDLFKDPFNRTLRIERRNKIQVRSSASYPFEEKYLTSLNKNITIRKWTLGKHQIRKIKLQHSSKWEIFVIKGNLSLVFSFDSFTLKQDQCLSLEFNPQWSPEMAPCETFKVASLDGETQVLVIQERPQPPT